MIETPDDLVGSLVLLLRDIPDLVEAMGGDETKIYAFEDRYPKGVSLNMAKYQMPAPGIMVAYEGCGPGSRGDFTVDEHQVTLSLRAAEDSGDDTPSGYYRLHRLIREGVPQSAEVRLEYLTVHSSCEPMGVPTLRRLTDEAGVDYWETLMTFKEL